MKITHANRFKAGDMIRAYEFKPMAGRDDCYHEGQVLDPCYKNEGYDCYLIQVTRHVFNGQSEPWSRIDHVIVPHYVSSFFEYSHRIVPI